MKRGEKLDRDLNKFHRENVCLKKMSNNSGMNKSQHQFLRNTKEENMKRSSCIKAEARSYSNSHDSMMMMMLQNGTKRSAK